MKILINTASTHKGGGVQVARSFIEECRNFTENKYYVILGKMLSELINPADFPANFTFSTIGYRPATRVFSYKFRLQYFKQVQNTFKPDVVFTTSGPAYWRPKAPHLVGYNLPHYIYRDSPFFNKVSMASKLKWKMKGEVLRYFFRKDADAYVVQTDDVNHRLKSWLNRDNIHTVSNTHSHFYDDQLQVDHKLSPKRNGEFRFLTLSAWHTHKNLKVIPKVIDKLPSDLLKEITFVLTLPQEQFDKEFSNQAGANIKNIGPVNPEEGPSLYRECDALFLPTLLECFSASYAEAMKMEKPIVTSDLGFAHTVCGNAALYFDPTNEADIAEKIVQLIEDTGLQEKLVENGKNRIRQFQSAKERAESYLQICKQLADGKIH